MQFFVLLLFTVRC